MFEQYNKRDYSGFDAWKTKVKLICEHRGVELDYSTIQETFDLEDLYNKGVQPRQAVEAMGKEIFGLK